MSLDFYDQSGKPYAYSEDGKTIYTFGGAPIAHLDGDSVYGFDGRHIGYFHNGAILDPGGNTLLFTNGAAGGPMKPMKQMKPMKGMKQMLPMKGMKQMLPMKGMKQMKPMKPMFSMGWSRLAATAVFGA